MEGLPEKLSLIVGDIWLTTWMYWGAIYIMRNPQRRTPEDEEYLIYERYLDPDDEGQVTYANYDELERIMNLYQPDISKWDTFDNSNLPEGNV
jgi:hypothetical protein